MKKIRSSFEWFPLPPFSDLEKGSVLDFSNLLDAPAGKYGRVKAKDDLLYFKGQHKPVRFNGTNLCFNANFPSHEQADRMVEELAGCGFNAVRFHHYDDLLVKHDEIRKDSTELDEKAIDALDYLFAACKRKGIYLITDFYVSRKLVTGEIPEFPDKALGMLDFKRLVLVNRNAFENLYRFSMNLMDHCNPYTGHLWKEDPALLSINLVNEGVVEAGYNDWIEEIYLDEFVKYAEKENLRVERSIKDPAYPDFLSYLYSRFNHIYRERIHRSGYHGLITDLNFLTKPHLTYFRKEQDIVENHFYHSHPSFPETPWRLPVIVNQESSISDGLSGMNYIFNSRILGKPFSITEWNHCFPSETYLEGSFLTGAYASLQNYSILCRFSWSHSLDSIFSDKRTVTFFDSAPDPLRCLSERVMSCLFLRGDVKAADSTCTYVMNLQEPGSFSKAFNEPDHPQLEYLSKLALVYRTGISFTDNILSDGKKMTAFYENNDLPEDKELIKNVKGKTVDMMEDMWKSCFQYDGTVKSSTDELEINLLKGNFKCVTPKSEAFVLKKGQTLDGNFVSVTVKNGFANFLVTSVDDLPLKESRRVLILHLSSCLNSNFDFTEQDGFFREFGTAPVLMRKNAGMICFNTMRKLHLWACNLSGKRIFELPVKKGIDGISQVADIQNVVQDMPIAVYELILE